MEHDRLGDLDVVPAEQFGQVDLVRAADDRLRIVDHDQAFARSPAGKTIRVMVDGRRFADEEGVELGDPPVVVGRDQLGPHFEGLGRLDEPLECVLVGGGVRLLGVMEDRHVVPRADPFFLRAAATLEVLPGDFDDEGPVPLGDVVGGDRGHAADLPFFVAS